MVIVAQQQLKDDKTNDHGSDSHSHTFPRFGGHGSFATGRWFFVLSCPHRPAIEKSSNAITESAFVHSPTLPASLKVASFASNTLLPSYVTTK